MTKMKLQIADIRTDAGTQVRECISEETVTNYSERMEDGDNFPSVIVFHDGNNYYLADGFHRVLASERIGAKTIDAEIKKGTAQDALWYALGANKAQGHRMTRGDIRNAVEQALRSFPDKTQQSISDQVGCSQQTVMRVQTELIQLDKLTIPATRTGLDGKERPTTYKRDKIENEEARYIDEQPTERTVTTETSTETFKYEVNAKVIADKAIFILTSIKKNDKGRITAFESVIKFCKKEMKG